jgi:hypothetical protein
MLNERFKALSLFGMPGTGVVVQVEGVIDKAEFVHTLLSQKSSRKVMPLRHKDTKDFTAEIYLDTD